MSDRASRRDFIRRAALGAAAPYLATTRLFAAAGAPAPSDQVRMGHIGIGGMGGGHLGGYCQNDRYPTVAVCDVDANHRTRAAERCKFRTVGVYNDFRELLDRPDIDAVVIATPDHWHALTSIYACEAGKDVYCEKPLSLTVREGRAMVRAARRYGRVFQVGSQQRSGGEFRKAVELVRNGRIGRVHTVLVGVWGPSHECYLPPAPVPEGLDWDLWLGPAPWRHFSHGIHPGAFRSYRDYSGGTNTDWGAHHMDIAQWGLGKDESGPTEIQFIEGQNTIEYRYPEGTVVRMGAVPANGIRFIGTEGVVEVNRGYFRTWPEAIGQETLGPGCELFRAPNGHAGNWHDCMKSRQRPCADVEIGHRSITACHLGNISYWLGGRKLRWDPVKEQILDDPEAAQWVSRPMRAPWHL